MASHQGHLDVVKFLVEAGVDLNPGNSSVARQAGHKQIFVYLKHAEVTA